MNRYGSYRALRANSKAALIASVEIYNKPRFDYREECCIILLVNAWELLLKAILSKNRVAIYAPKERNKPYQTLSIFDSLRKAKPYFPERAAFQAVERNLDHLVFYRNNAIHFYNQKGFGVLVYNLAQASILNYRDLSDDIFGGNLANEVTLHLLPLALGFSLDPIEYINSSNKKGVANKAVEHFIREVVSSIESLDKEGIDLGRLLTVVTVKLESTKKISKADITAGVTASNEFSGQIILERRFDPNDPNWGRQKEMLEKLPPALHGIQMTSYAFQAILWKYKIKYNQQYCWKSKENTLTKYSFELVSFIKKLSKADVLQALKDFKEHNRNIRKVHQKP